MTHDVAVQVRGYLVVFGALLALTVATVGVSYLNLPIGTGIAVGLAIAALKATLVAAVFMHLRHERALIYATLSATAFVAVTLVALILWTESDHAPGARFTAPFSVITTEAPPTEEAH
jgi:caa(3)-type oxidase subunit IV